MFHWPLFAWAGFASVLLTRGVGAFIVLVVLWIAADMVSALRRTRGR